jgi:exonuclease III
MSNLKLYKIASINMGTIRTDHRIRSLKNFIIIFDVDIVLLQEVYSSDLELNGFHIVFNVNEKKRGTAILLRSHIQYTEVFKSFDSGLISLRINDNLTLCNVYAPSGTSKRKDRKEFFKNVLSHCSRYEETMNLLLGGDFNCVINKKDSIGTSNYDPDLGIKLHSMQLIDTYEILNENHVEYTYIRAPSAARLDRMYVSRELSRSLREALVYTTDFSDHKSYVIHIELSNLNDKDTILQNHKICHQQLKVRLELEQHYAELKNLYDLHLKTGNKLQNIKQKRSQFLRLHEKISFSFQVIR